MPFLAAKVDPCGSYLALTTILTTSCVRLGAPGTHKLSYWRRHEQAAKIRDVPTLELFAFRFRHPRTGKWIRARYLAELPEIQRRYSEWEIIGSPEVRHVPDDARSNQFNPFQPSP